MAERMSSTICRLGRGQGVDAGLHADEGRVIVARNLRVPPPPQAVDDGLDPVSHPFQLVGEGGLLVRHEVDQERGEVGGVPPRLLGSIHHPRDAQDHVLDEDILDHPESVGAVAVEQVDALGITEELLV